MREEDSPVVSIRNAATSVGGRDLWSGLDADIDKGELVAVLGPNGAGKSTLLEAILGMHPLISGEITILGTSPRHSRRSIGYLPQRRLSESVLGVRGVDIVRLGVDGARWGFRSPIATKKRSVDDEKVKDAVALVGADAYAHRPLRQTSGGERQRLLIAQAMVRDPRLLLLDEPLDGLDLPNQHNVISLLDEVRARRQTTVVMVAHDVNPILQSVDKVIYIAEGRALIGSVSEVITSEALSSLYGSAVEVLTTTDGRVVVVGGGEMISYHAHHE